MELSSHLVPNRTMEKYNHILFCTFSLFFIVSIVSPLCSAADDDRKAYIVYMGSLPEFQYSAAAHHLSMLQEVIGDRTAEDMLITNYRRSFNGFAARLTSQEAQKLAEKDGVVSVFPSKTLKLHTTRSWDFMGLTESVARNPKAESDIIVGILDSGIWPESESFSDEGFGPPPAKWQGKCNGGKNFTCNNKLIGARFYNSFTIAADSARDEVGHGTHTASTVVGNKVSNVSFYGLGMGKARGGVNSARVAAYRVCTSDCPEEFILAGFDDAIADGVDIISVSLGGNAGIDFNLDPVSIGAFHAMTKGILTVQSAGNEGPLKATVASLAPWLLSVAASTKDAKYIENVVLGNGTKLIGSGINSFSLNGTQYPLAYGSKVTSKCSEAGAQYCNSGCLDSDLVKGKIVVCDQAKAIATAYEAGAVGAIVPAATSDNTPFVVPFPAISLAGDEFDSLKSYLNSTETPQAEILRTEVIKDGAAPVVASFSSRGPNILVADLLKPDITAPGVAILAGYTPVTSPSSSGQDPRRVNYNILSGTSMSCPHVAAISAYVKSFHPDWSPSVIMSAIMTTAVPMNISKHPDAEFAYGSGHVNPVQALNPGLVYNASEDNYVNFLCSIGYSSALIGQVTGRNRTCSSASKEAGPKNLNYPSMTAAVAPSTPFSVTFQRTVTNVGTAPATYTAKVSTSSTLKIKVVPETLSFNSLHEEKSFNVTVDGGSIPARTIVSSSLEWSDGQHNVRSPIVVHTM